MAVNNEGEELPPQLGIVKLIRELAIALDKDGDLPVSAQNAVGEWAAVEDVVIQGGQLRILVAPYNPED